MPLNEYDILYSKMIFSDMYLFNIKIINYVVARREALSANPKWININIAACCGFLFTSDSRNLQYPYSVYLGRQYKKKHQKNKKKKNKKKRKGDIYAHMFKVGQIATTAFQGTSCIIMRFMT